MIEIQNSRNVLFIEFECSIINKIKNEDVKDDFGDLEIGDRIYVKITRTKTALKKAKSSNVILGSFVIKRQNKVLKKLQYDYLKFAEYFVDKQIIKMYDQATLEKSKCNYIIEIVQ